MNALSNTMRILHFGRAILWNGQQSASSLHIFSRLSPGIIPMHGKEDLLKPTCHTIIPANTIQTRTKVRKMCPKCYIIWRQDRKYVYCKEHPSHNQQTKWPKPKETYIITHKTHGRIRPW